jgi:hypothetical protein
MQQHAPISFNVVPQGFHLDRPTRHDPYFVAGSRKSEEEAALKELLENNAKVQKQILEALAPGSNRTLYFGNAHDDKLYTTILQIRDADRVAPHYERSRAAAHAHSPSVDVAFVDAKYLDGNRVRVVRTPADAKPELILVDRESATANDIVAGFGLLTEIRRRYGDLIFEPMSASLVATDGSFTAEQLAVADRLLSALPHLPPTTLEEYGGDIKVVAYRLGPVSP